MLFQYRGHNCVAVATSQRLKDNVIRLFDPILISIYHATQVIEAILPVLNEDEAYRFREGMPQGNFKRYHRAAWFATRIFSWSGKAIYV